MRRYLNLSINYVISLVLFVAGCEKPTEPDTTPPSVTITSPVSGAIVFEIVTITSVATDNEGISKVQLWIDGYNQEGIEDSKEPYELKWNTTSYDDGSAHTITVRAYDKSDNMNDSNPISVIVDNTNSYPKPVNIVSIVYDIGQMSITWEKSDASDFSKYDLLYSDSEQGYQETVITKTNIDDTTYTLTDFDPTQENWYWVSVTDSLGYTSIGSSYVVLDSVPTLIEINTIKYENNTFVINWSQSIDEDFSNYLLYESFYADMSGETVIFESNNILDTTYIVQGITPGEARYYRLVSQDIWGLKTSSSVRKAISVLFSATFTNDWHSEENGEGILFISDTLGNVIAETTWIGNESFEILPPTDITTIPEKISITTVTKIENEWGIDVNITTNLNIPVGSQWTWKGYPSIDYENPVGTLELDFQNIPDHAGYMISSLWDSRSSTSGTLNSPYTFDIFESPVDIYIKLNTLYEDVRYLWINNMTGGYYQVDLSQIAITNSISINLPYFTGFSAYLYGYPNPGSHYTGRYRLDRIWSPDSMANAISLKYPPESFTDYRTSIFMFEDYSNIGFWDFWYQTTYGDIPNSFEKINGDFQFINYSPNDFHIDVTGIFDEIRSVWNYTDINEVGYSWYVYGPAYLSQYSLPSFSNLVNQYYPNIDKSSFIIGYSDLIDHSQLGSYEDILNILFKSPDYFYNVVDDFRARVKAPDSGILSSKRKVGKDYDAENYYKTPHR